MKCKFTCLCALIMIAFTQNILAAERPDLGNLVYTYGGCGRDAVATKVHVLRYGPKSDKTFLVQILGIDHPLNGKPIVYQAKDLQSEKLRYSFLNEQNDKVLSSLIFDGGDTDVTLYVKGYTGLLQSSNVSSDKNKVHLCLIDYSLDPYQYYRRYEK